jgi:hypothetical protein
MIRFLSIYSALLCYVPHILAGFQIAPPDSLSIGNGNMISTSGWYQVPHDLYFPPDAFHSFNKRRHVETGLYKGLNWGGRMFQGQEIPKPFEDYVCVAPGGINQVLADYKTRTGKNAEVKLIEFTLLDFGIWRCEWTAYIGESTDSIHYTHVGSRGGIGVGGRCNPDSVAYNKHPGTSGNIPVHDIQLGHWKYVPIRILEVKSAQGYCPNEKSQPGTVEVVNHKNILQLRQFFVQSNTKIY